MNRRTSLKSIIFLTAVGASSFSIYRWFSINSAADFSTIHRKKELLAELAEVIIPRTNTPGAKDAKVEEFILKMLEFCTEKKSQNNFINGLDDLEKYTIETYKKPFINCSASEKISVLKFAEEKSKHSSVLVGKIYHKMFGKPFFTKLKELTVEGYCTSQIGATQGLAYDYIPGKFQACIPLLKNQRSWATK
jgi:hypothetical protein